jgi:hypothetical protein
MTRIIETLQVSRLSVAQVRGSLKLNLVVIGIDRILACFEADRRSYRYRLRTT